MKKLYYTLILSISLFACEKEAIESAEEVVVKEDPFQEYVDRFFAEGEKRGVQLDQDNLWVGYMPPTSDQFNSGFCGYGYWDYKGTGQKRVEIHPDAHCWDDRSDIEKEGFMFHELGHAVLERQHLNIRLPGGLERSMMCGSPNNCNQFALYNDFTPALREYYLDELFLETTPVPDWAKEKTTQTIFFEDDFSNPGNWVFREANVSTPNAFIGSKINTDSTNALKIQASDRLLEGQFSSWSYTFSNPVLKEGTSLKLTATISANSLSGTGAAIALRTDSGTRTRPSGFSTSQGLYPIKGIQNQRTFSITLDYVPTEINTLYIFLLMLPESSGSVYFEDMRLEVLE